MKVYIMGLVGAFAGLSLPFWGSHGGFWHIVDAAGVILGAWNLYNVYDYWRLSQCDR
jgi:hypothetical protein